MTAIAIMNIDSILRSDTIWEMSRLTDLGQTCLDGLIHK